MEKMHNLLKRQIRRYLSSQNALSQKWQPFIDAVNDAYIQSDADRALLEHSLELSSQELLAANAKLRAVYERLIESSPDGVFAFDRECRYTVWNSAMERIFGLSKLQTLGKRAQDVCLASKGMGEEHLFSDALAGKTVSTGERLYVMPKTGEPRFFETHYSPLLAESGEIIGGLAIMRDITKQKHTEETLRRQNDYLAALQETALRLTGQLELTELLADMVMRVSTLMGTPHTFIALVQQDSFVIVVRFGSGLFHDLIGLRFEDGQGLVSLVRKTGQPVVVDNYQGLPGLGLDALRAWAEMPLLKGSQVIGVIGVARTEENRPFCEDEVAPLKQFAQLASIALDNAQLYKAAQQELTERARAEEELRQARDELEIRVQERTTQLTKTNAELSHAMETAEANARENARLYQEANSQKQYFKDLYAQAQELAALQERHRLARELHDSISQALYGISLGAHTAREALEGEPEQAIAPIVYVIDLAEAGLAEMHALIFELRPESLEAEGLVAAITKQVAVLRARYKLIVEVDLEDEPDLPIEMKEALYRVAQEALHNIVKHARASVVVLRLTKQKNEITLEVHDNGRGFDPTGSFPGHLGLSSMRERVAKAGGTLAIESMPGQGTGIRVCVSKAGLGGERRSVLPHF
jgi:PAS domain S-box-containing protein